MRVTNVMASSLDGLLGSSSIEGDVERRDTGLFESDLSHLLELMRSSDATGASSIRSNKECYLPAHDMSRIGLFIVKMLFRKLPILGSARY